MAFLCFIWTKTEILDSQVVTDRLASHFATLSFSRTPKSRTGRKYFLPNSAYLDFLT
jgi:hypothetical protein